MFNIHPTKAYKLTNSEIFEDDGKNPVVVNSSYSNGIGGYTNLNPTENAGIITFSDTTSADAIFYQDKDFVGYPHVQGMYPLEEYKQKWSKYSLLFLLTEFKKSAFALGFNYANKFTRELAKEININLPITSTGEPDWAYMEEYMRNLEIITNDFLTKLKPMCGK